MTRPPRPAMKGRTPAIAPFDHEVFVALVDDLGSRDLAVDFLTAFTASLDVRIRRIERALRDQDPEELVTALLSLRSSAAMTGAHQLLASTTRALADGVGAPVGPLVRKLQGQAHLFIESTRHIRDAAAGATTSTTDTSADSSADGADGTYGTGRRRKLS